MSLLVLARGFRQADYVAMLDEVRPQCPLLRETVVLEDAWEDLLADGEDVAEADLEAIEATLDPADPINVQFTSGTTGAPKGATLSHRNILNNGYFTGLILRYTEDDRVCVPVPFYHCFGMVLANLACLTHGACLVVPGASFDPRHHAARRRGGALHVAVRRADDVHRPARASAHRRLRPVEPPDGDHGRGTLPGGGDEPGPLADAHGRGHDRLRHDRDRAALDPDGGRRRRRQARDDRRPRAPARGGQDRRSRDRRHRPARHARRAVHARLQRDARLLGRRARHGRAPSTPTAGCTPATWRPWTTTAT